MATLSPQGEATVRLGRAPRATARRNVGDRISCGGYELGIEAELEVGKIWPIFRT